LHTTSSVADRAGLVEYGEVFIYTSITIIVFPITKLPRSNPTASTSVEYVLIYDPITVIIKPITKLISAQL
jgi:hypothetical protein